jgi:class 3 adenylate cyclase
MEIRLEWQAPDGTGGGVLLEDRVFVGRTCRGVDENRRILIRDANVSRDHAVVTRFGNKLFIRDSSRNGTRVNGVRLTGGTDQPLYNGDRIDIGPYRINVVVDNSDADQTLDDDTFVTQTISLKQYVTHLVADVRGFSTLSQQSDSNQVRDVINRIYEQFSQVIHEHHGTVKDYAGDAIFAFWEHGVAPDAQVAIAACQAVRSQFGALPEMLADLPDDLSAFRQLKIGWGVSTGNVTLSHYGVRNDNLAVVGDTTNLAFRLCTLAGHDVPSPVAICHHTAQLVNDVIPLRLVGHYPTKGREGLEAVYTFAEI